MKTTKSNTRFILHILFSLLFLDFSINLNGQAPCVTYVYPSSMNFQSSSGQTNVIGLGLSSPDCSYGYSVESGASSWITVTKYSNYQLNVTCTTNSTNSPRTGRIYIDNARYTVTVTQDCFAPTQPGSISGTTTVCANVSTSYSIAPVSGATSYNWSVSNGTIVSGQGTTNAQVSFNNNGSATVSVTANSSCGSSPARTLNVNSIIVPTPGAISGATTACAQTSTSYSISAVSGADSYTWTLPSGASGSSTSNSINVTMGASSGYISVKANQGSCVSSVSQSYITVPSAVAYTVRIGSEGNTICEGQTTSITLDGSYSDLNYKVYLNDSPLEFTVKQGTGGGLTFPGLSAGGNYTVKAIDPASGCAMPMNGSVNVTVNPRPLSAGAITGTFSVIPGQTGVTYSVPAITHATGYVWSLPSGATITSGTNTNSITVNYSCSASSGNVSVYGTNSCGNGNSSSQSVTVTGVGTPGSIIGATTVCAQTSSTYSISAVSGADSYTWTLPSGASGSSTSNSINVTLGASSDNISVIANKGSCSSPSSQLYITVPSAVAYTVGGGGTICDGQTTNVTLNGSHSSLTYKVYLNDSPLESTTQTGTGSGLTFTGLGAAGTYTVKAISSGCTILMSGSANITVNPKPLSAGTITGTFSVIPGQTGVTYSVPAITHATGYVWSLPSGATITSGTNTNSITVNYSCSASSGNVSVYGTNSCGNGNSSSQSVTVTGVGTPGSIIGATTVCAQTSSTYSISAVSGADSYTWTLPSGASGSSTSNSINVTLGASSDNISVIANKGSCSSPSSQLYITVPSAVAYTVGGGGTICDGQTTNVTLNGSHSSLTYKVYLNDSPLESTTQTGTGSGLTFTGLVAAGTYTVKAISSGCTILMSGSANITVNPKPLSAGTITGTFSVIPGQTGVTYSVPAITHATGYVWSLPSGATITSGTNTNSITVNYSCSASSGNVSVYGTNSCGNGNSSSQSVTVTGVGTPGAITGAATVCAQTSGTYSITAVSGADSYTWTLPSGASGSSTSNSINVTFGTSSGIITVKANKGNCSSATSQLSVTVPSAVAYTVAIGPEGSSICEGQTTSITLNGSYSALNYKVYLNNSPLESTIKPGTGSGLTFSGLGAGGSYTVKAIDPVSLCVMPMSNSVTVTVNPQPATPTAFSVSTNNCGDKTLTRGTPPTNVTWYWQGTTSGGTSTVNSATTYTASSSGTYYLRAFTTVGNCWSGSSASTAVTVNPYPANPGNPTASANACGDKTLTRAGAPPANVTWYWQGTTLDGTSTALGSGTNYAANTSGTFYIRAQSSAGCWSSGSGSVAVTVNPLPAAPTAFTVSTNNCGDKTLTRGTSLPANTTWYWQGTTLDGTSTANSNLTYATSSSGTYYLRAFTTVGSCWSASSASSAVTVNAIPANPGNPTASTNTCGDKTLTRAGTPPANVTWYWQGTASAGTNTGLGSGTTYAASSTNTYYIRALSSASCWSNGSGSVAVTVSPNPSAPTVVQPYLIAANTTTTLTASGAGTNEVYKWYTTSSGGTPLGSTTTPVLTATTNYYVTKYNNVSTCESTPRTLFTVTINQQPVVNAGTDKTIEIPVNQVTLAGSATDDGTIQSYLWSQVSGPSVLIPSPANGTVTISNLIEGTYVFRLTATDNYNLSAYDEVTVMVNPDGSGYVSTLLMNSVETRTFGQDGAINGQAISYYDDLGRPLQSLGRSMVTGRVTTSQPVYDALGRAAISTLPVPVVQNSLEYIPDFVTNASGTPYGYDNFEKTTPDAISGKLADYYSNSNTDEPYVPVSAYPYTRTGFSSILSGAAIKSAMAGENHAFGSGHESYSFTMPVLDYELLEFDTIPTYGFRNLKNLNKQDTANLNFEYKALTKTVSEDPDGKTSISYVTGDGRTIATCYFDPAAGNKKVSGVLDPSIGYLDLHITHNQTVYFLNTVSISVYNLKTDQLVGNYTAKSASLAKGFYRIVFNNPIPAGSIFSYWAKYTGWAFNFYDEAGRVVYTLSPKSFNEWKSSSYTNRVMKAFMQEFATWYKYNSLGWLLASQSIDEGLTEYRYAKDGKLRYSQNAQQRADGKYSYTNYDNAQRAVESGEYTGVFANANVDNPVTGGLQTTSTVYDIPENTGVSGFEQHYTYGAVSKTYNDNATTWYSYTYDGKVEWIIKQLPDVSKKTIKYEYDFDGRVIRVLYQDGQSDAFTHRYQYDADGRLEYVYTKNGLETEKTQARYIYYLHGPLKRVELAQNLQGTDYVYTINGWLKSINNPNLDNTDPGADGFTGNHATFGKDVFGMGLDYFNGDYTHAGTNIVSVPGTGNYNGNIAASRWKIASQPTDVGKQWSNQYLYNVRNWLTTATFGTVDASNAFLADPNKNYKEVIKGYDLNGNISSVMRYGAGVKDSMVYRYLTRKNRLNYIDVYNNIGAGVPGNILDQGGTNYKYDAMGRISGNVRETQYFTYDVYGHVTAMYNNAAKTGTPVSSYVYDDAGFRIRKIANGDTTWYVRDGSGNILATYLKSNTTTPKLDEVNLYGSGRIGMVQANASGVLTSYVYELTDHLGNVRATITTDGNDAGTEPDVLSYSDYYAFGMVMPGRNLVASDAYRFGYQGQYAEKDPETGYNHFEARDFDSRIGRWLIPDPARQYWSPYMAMGNNPVYYLDPKGEIGDPFGLCFSLYQGVLYRFGSINSVFTYTLPEVKIDLSEFEEVPWYFKRSPKPKWYQEGGLEGSSEMGRYYGNNGFKRLGDDLSSVQFYVKGVGIGVSVLGAPEFGMPIYAVGEGMDKTSDVIMIGDAINRSDANTALIYTGGLFFESGFGKLVKLKDPVRKFAVDALVDKVADYGKGYLLKLDPNAAPRDATYIKPFFKP